CLDCCLHATRLASFQMAVMRLLYWSERDDRSYRNVGAPLAGNTSHLRTSHWKRRCERIKQVDKIEELIFRIERFGWRHPAFLRFVLVIDLLDLPAVDPQPTWWQDVACHLVPQARKQRHDRLIWLHSEHE